MPKINTKTAAKTATATATAATVAPKIAAPTARELHATAGLTAKYYAGSSEYLNGNCVPAVLTDCNPRTTLTARMHGTLRAMREAYGAKPFAARGIDNGVLSQLIAADMLALVATSGTRGAHPKSGNPCAFDGATPLLCKLTASGVNSGQAMQAKPKAITKA